jgi:NAD(P)-dependent dehydrogenase (short-subunit alcohol dehydrogenase family)
MLTRQAALDLKALGICVISLSPGWVKTDMGGDEAKYEVQESVRLLSSTIEKVSLKDSGTFIGEDGLPIPW